jgi:acetoin utilization protein AcuC
MSNLTIVHSPAYANWIFDPTHPTQGRRFMLGADMTRAMAEAAGLEVDIIEPHLVTPSVLHTVHSHTYVASVIEDGISDEWTGVRFDMATLASMFVGGTLAALDALDDEETLTAVHLPGAKHHAMTGHSSGFCIFADFAIAAHRAVRRGHRVAILDIDAHHGDGTEALCWGEDAILTYSIHEDGIFPGTGRASDVEHQAFNHPLLAGAGDRALRLAVRDFLREAAIFKPTMIFLAAGADGHVTDPLSRLRYTVDGLAEAATALRTAHPSTPILMGGAGGYTPDGATPFAWASMATALAGGL